MVYGKRKILVKQQNQCILAVYDEGIHAVYDEENMECMLKVYM